MMPSRPRGLPSWAAKGVPTIFGVERWRYRSLVRALGRTVWRQVTHRSTAFEGQLDLAGQAGSIWGRLVWRCRQGRTGGRKLHDEMEVRRPTARRGDHARYISDLTGKMRRHCSSDVRVSKSLDDIFKRAGRGVEGAGHEGRVEPPVAMGFGSGRGPRGDAR